MPPYVDPANTLCTNGKPVEPTSFCPLPLTVTENKTYPLRLTISGTSYPGTLEVDWEDRFKRITTLLAGLFSLAFRIQKVTDGKLKWLVSFKNPFKVTTREESFQVDESGMPAIATMLIQIDKKLDFIHGDLARIEPVSSIIEHWQLKPEAARQQVALLWGTFGPFDVVIGPPKYQTTIPHCNTALLDAATNKWGYEKGEIQLLVTLADNSKIIMYVKSKAEGQRVFGLISPFIEPAMLAGGYTKWGEYKGPPFKPGLLRLRRVDHYNAGLERQTPSRRIYFPADPNSVP